MYAARMGGILSLLKGVWKRSKQRRDYSSPTGLAGIAHQGNWLLSKPTS